MTQQEHFKQAKAAIEAAVEAEHKGHLLLAKQQRKLAEFHAALWRKQTEAIGRLFDPRKPGERRPL